MSAKKTTANTQSKPKIKLPTKKEILLAMINAATPKELDYLFSLSVEYQCNKDEAKDLPLYQGHTEDCHDCNSPHPVFKINGKLVALDMDSNNIIRAVTVENKPTFTIVR